MIKFIQHTKGKRMRLTECFDAWDEQGIRHWMQALIHISIYFVWIFFVSKLKQDQLLFTQCQCTKYFIISIKRRPSNWMLKFSISSSDFFRKSPLPVIIACWQGHLQRERTDFCENSPRGIHGAIPSNSLISKWVKKIRKTVFIHWNITKKQIWMYPLFDGTFYWIGPLRNFDKFVLE